MSEPESIIEVTAEVHDQMCALALAEYPLEACGLMVGEPGSDRIVKFFPCRNVEKSARIYTIDPKPELKRSTELQSRNSEFFDLTFTGIGGARIYAKYARPTKASTPHPAILEFHGYTGNSGDWSDKLRFSGDGVAIAAMDCRGQGGRSQDPGGTSGSGICPSHARSR